MRKLTEAEYRALDRLEQHSSPSQESGPRSAVVLRSVGLIREGKLTVRGMRVLRQEREARGAAASELGEPEYVELVRSTAARGLSTGRLTQEETRRVCGALLAFTRLRGGHS